MDRLENRGGGDVVSGTVLLVLAVAYLLATRGLPAAADAAEPGPAFFPRLLGASLVVLSLVILVRGRSRSVEPPTGSGSLRRPLLVMSATLAYAVSLSVLGFTLATLAYTSVVTASFRPRPGWHWLAVPLGTTLFAYAFFSYGLGVSLPGSE